MMISNTSNYQQQLREHMEYANFAEKSIKSYLSCLKNFKKYLRDNNINEGQEYDHIKTFLLYKRRNGSAPSTINSYYSALRLYTKYVCNRSWNIDQLPRPIRANKLPKILSKEDVKSIIEASSNYRNFTILSVLYGTGMRLSEVANLKIADIDGNRLQIRVNQAKGNKDRMVDMPQSLLLLLREYYKFCRPRIYLFCGQNYGQPISHRTIQHIFNIAKIKANIIKDASVHTLRHCYATHHLEDGTDIVNLKLQLGHNSLKTTVRYIHVCANRVTKISHPLEKINPQFRRPK
jgi:integrase/recombinase XerD